MKLRAELASWKEIWSIFISDKEFRNFFTDTHDYTVRPSSVKKINRNVGTIHLPGTRGSGEDHFIAYKKYKDRIDIFDPADTSGRYNSFLNNTTKEKISKLASKPVRVLNYHPQCHKGDTFCQTWSLAWLKPNLQKYVIGVKNKNQSIENIYKICYKISHSIKFKQYMLFRPNIPLFRKIIDKSRIKFGLPPTMSVLDFVKFSQSLTLSQIKEIFG